MTFLPIVERELRVATRRRFTWVSRIVAAAFALVIFGLMQGLSAMAGGFVAAGREEFLILSRLAFVFACAAGVFLTSDAISEEKREGTLGLLFLTDLRGYDVVLGKWFSQMLRAFYAVLAAFPVLALPLLAGGLTGREFALTLLTVVNTLFFSLATGLLISTFSRDYTKAMSGTAVVILLFLVVASFADRIVAAASGSAFHPFFSFADPAWLLTRTAAYAHREFWMGLGIQHGIAWAFLLVASLFAPRVWQERARHDGGARTGMARRWRYGGARARLAMRRRWLEVGPVHWLAMRDHWLPRMVSALTLLILLTGGGTLVAGILEYRSGATSSSVSLFAVMAAGMQTVFGLGLTLWIAARASQIFVDSVREGALELLLVTPVTARAIVHAQWAALVRTFLLPALCVVLLQLGAGVLSALETNRTLATTMTRAMAAANTARTNGVASRPVATNALVVGGSSSISITYSSSGTSASGLVAYQMASAVVGAVTSLAGLAALAWFGMWMGLSNRKISMAVLKTVCFVSVLPWIAYLFLYGFVLLGVMLSSRNNGQPYWGLFVASFVGALFNLGKDALFIWWGREHLLTEFRAAVAQDRGQGAPRPYQPPRTAAT
jgi:ABC-type transport system involved in multi-copper enzyme maturation permease subunit